MQLNKDDIVRLEAIREIIINATKEAEEIVLLSWNPETIEGSEYWIEGINEQLDNNGSVLPTPTLQDTINDLWDDLYL